MQRVRIDVRNASSVTNIVSPCFASFSDPDTFVSAVALKDVYDHLSSFCRLTEVKPSFTQYSNVLIESIK